MGTPQSLQEQIEAAFDYRGDVTVTLAGGEQIVGFLFNRDLRPAREAPYVELFLPAGGRRKIEVARIESVALTGRDHAAKGAS
ncbi:MAG: hypothetical protein D6731_05500 [Planctomycetota bacterium]|nr:MAG: hypothetical protein D6731_05500 [Planctomycetota bacterium]